ncbi:MAG: hypothetical protein M1826_006698 [Phylliscum demangeonii]|nr:MAG: hypothetical protein M1826_006698 [Phylliscum demangeonii]
MAAIRAIERQSVHQIQSGQVIVDLCSVVKELVENSLDAGATSVEVRFKEHGLDAIEVQDNGEGISPGNYETVALKHFTSKLSTYADLDSLQTFGFRGEALSSLTAVAALQIVTSQADEAPKGRRLDFDRSGKLQGTQVVAAQKGTTVVVEDLFKTLPVRRRELEKNIKREYGKVLGILQAYACISTGVRFVVSHQTSKGKKATVFATQSNQSTKENIMNVFGTKILASLLPLDLKLEIQYTRGRHHPPDQDQDDAKTVRIVGLISRPTFGEGRQTPDRQVFFVNKRPCSLPQVAKAFNEVYRSYNVAQSPFIFADLKLDTNAYDVNVSPDKRTILLHDQPALLEALKTSVTELFEGQNHTVPHTPLGASRLPTFKQLSITRTSTYGSDHDAALSKADQDTPGSSLDEESQQSAEPGSPSDSSHQAGEQGAADLWQTLVRRAAVSREPGRRKGRRQATSRSRRVAENLTGHHPESPRSSEGPAEDEQRAAQEDDGEEVVTSSQAFAPGSSPPAVKEEAWSSQPAPSEDSIMSTSVGQSRPAMGIVEHAFNHMRPRRPADDTATVTIGSKTTISPMKPPMAKRIKMESRQVHHAVARSAGFVSSLRAFAAPGSQLERVEGRGIGNRFERPDADDDPESVGGEGGSGTSEDAAPEVAEEMSEPEGGNMSSDDLDAEPFDEARKKADEEKKVEELIHAAEQDEIEEQKFNLHRLRALESCAVTSSSSCQLVQRVHTSVGAIEQQIKRLRQLAQLAQDDDVDLATEDEVPAESRYMSVEERLSLTVSKDDFSRMRIVGQFNLGFILTTRWRSSRGARLATGRTNTTTTTTTAATATARDELFIIDQHASDEIYNFERLQATTIVQNQPLVTRLALDLTAMQEEVVMEHTAMLEKNGFGVAVDASGQAPVGRRCQLVRLPMSKEVVFGAPDLEELLALLAEARPASSASASSTSMMTSVLRPSKVRRMLAMRACRSSIMVGRSLSRRQMTDVVRHMGEMDRPWNCPHGRPTMRHLITLDEWRAERPGADRTAAAPAPAEAWSTDVKAVGGDGVAVTAADRRAALHTWMAYLRSGKRVGR